MSKITSFLFRNEDNLKQKFTKKIQIQIVTNNLKDKGAGLGTIAF